MLEEK
jgi:hypothetical protein